MLTSSNYLLSEQSIGGRLFLKSKSDSENWMRDSLSKIHYEIVCLTTNEHPNNIDKRPQIFALAATLQANLNNPIHYGDNTPGFTNFQGQSLVPAPIFTFFDLWQFGVTGEDGLTGFLEDCGAPKETAEISVIAVTGLLLVDSALAAMDDGRLAWAGRLMSQAQSCLEMVLLLKLSQSKQGEIQSAIRAAIQARGVKAMQARYAKDTDGKQAIKRWVKACWQDWKTQPERYKNASAFARDMLDKQPERLTTEVVVTRWVRDWEKEEVAS